MKNIYNKSKDVCRQSARMAFASCLAGLVCLFSVSSVRAQTTLYWDGDGTGAVGNPPTSGVGGSGTWDLTTSNWWNGTSYTTWANLGGATGTQASFGGTAGAVTIDAGGVRVGVGTSTGVNVTTSGYSFSGGPVTFDFTGASADRIMYFLNAGTAMTVNNNTIIQTYTSSGMAFTALGSLNYSNAMMTVSGNIGLASTETGGTKFVAFRGGGYGGSFLVTGSIKDYDSTGSGAKIAVTTGDGPTDLTLTLSGTNSYTGGTKVNSGTTVYASNNSALGTGIVGMDTGVSTLIATGGVTIANGVDLDNYASSRQAIVGGNSAQVSTFSGNIRKWNQGGGTTASGQNLSLTAAAGGTVNITGSITDFGSNNLAISKIGQGVVKLTSGNTYSGTTQVYDGTLLVNNTTGSATGTGAVVVGSVASTTTTSTTAYNSNTVTVGDTSGLRVGQSVSGTGIQSGTIIAAISNSTTIVLNKSASNTSAVASLTFAAQAGVLGGTGTIAGATTVNSGAAIAPGDLTTGTLTLQSGLDIEGTYNWEIGANSVATGFDSIALTGGGLTLGTGSVLNIATLGGVDFSNSFWTTNHSWNVIDNSGSGTLTGAFGSLTGVTSNAEGSFSLSYGSGAGADATLNWTAVPEPSAWILIGIGYGLILLSRRSPGRRSA